MQSCTLQIPSGNFMLTGKRILVISPQPWGKMFVAKHHYAAELGKRGNEVYFLNPPSAANQHGVQVEELSAHPGLHLVNHRLSFPDLLRFKARPVYDFLMKRHVQKVIRALGKPVDIVWCFDLNLYSNLAWFKAPVKIYHPVDELFYNYQVWPAKNADIVMSVTKEILSKFSELPVKKMLVNHGISTAFKEASSRQSWTKKDHITIGYSGNLLRPDIDFPTLKACISGMPHVTFLFWGNYIMKESNLAGNENSEVKDFIEFLKNSSNVSLRGQMAQDELVRQYGEADIFLICYDINKDQSRGTNYHKVIEFLSTGKVVVSNNITSYAGSDLLRMCSSRTDNNEYFVLLKDTIDHIEIHNSPAMQQKRKDFAGNNTYEQHLVKIGEALCG